MGGAPARQVPIGTGLMALMVMAVFSTAGAIHYQTPMLAQMAAELEASQAQIGWVATLSFGGFFLGTLLLVPLGDCFDKRRLVLAQMSGVMVSLLAMAAAPSLITLALAAFMVGACSSVSHQVISLASELAPSEVRGDTVGSILSGVFIGILFARLTGGLVASHFSWRLMYLIAAGMVLVMIMAVFARLPTSPPKTPPRLARLFASMWHLWLDHPRIRRAATIQFLIGVGYGGFWATLAAMLLQLHGLGPTAAGLMAIPGAAGILVSRAAGRWTDRSGAAPVVMAASLGVIVAFAVLAFASLSVVAVMIGAILLDAGLRAAMVANQTLVIGISPEARGRASTVLMVHVWGGNAVGAWMASMALTGFGWLAVCGLCFSAAALALMIASRRSAASVTPG